MGALWKPEPYDRYKNYRFTSEPGDGWRKLIDDLYPDWRLEDWYYPYKGETRKAECKKFVATYEGREVSELDFGVRLDLEVGQKVATAGRVGFGVCHGNTPSSQDTFPAGVTGTILEMGVYLGYSCGRHEPRAHVVVQLDPETVPGRHKFIACLPPGPLIAITEARREGRIYGGLFAT